MKSKVPRKKKKQIPTGWYCYQRASDWKIFKDGGYGFTVRLCPFYTRKGEGVFGGHCKLIDGEVIDQVKSCNLKWKYK